MIVFILFFLLLLTITSGCEVSVVCQNCKCDLDTSVGDGIRVGTIAECIENLGPNDRYFSFRDIHCIPHEECPEEHIKYDTTYDWVLYEANCQPDPKPSEYNAWLQYSEEWGSTIWCVFEEADLLLFYCFDSPHSDCFYGEGTIIWHECADSCDDTLCPGLNSLSPTASPTEVVPSTTTATNLKCFIEDCGCPGTFLQPWCSSSTAVMETAYCQQSSAACGQCSGMWCPQTTITTILTSVPTSLPSFRPSESGLDSETMATLPSRETTLQVDAAVISENEKSILENPLLLPAAFCIIVVSLCVACFWIWSFYKFKEKKMKYETNDTFSNVTSDMILDIAPESLPAEHIPSPSEGVRNIPDIGEATWRATMLDVSEFSPTRYGGSEVSLTESEGSLYAQRVTGLYTPSETYTIEGELPVTTL